MQEAAGCERTVITYSSLIAACERDGHWELALQMYSQMLREGCTPNIITYNSLIAALAVGAQWERAAEVFVQLQRQVSWLDMRARVCGYESPHYISPPHEGSLLWGWGWRHFRGRSRPGHRARTGRQVFSGLVYSGKGSRK